MPNNGFLYNFKNYLDHKNHIYFIYAALRASIPGTMKFINSIKLLIYISKSSKKLCLFAKPMANESTNPKEDIEIIRDIHKNN